MLEAVQAALEKPTKEEGPPPSEPGKTEASAEQKAEADPTKKVREEDVLTPEEENRLSQKTKARFKTILDQRNKAESALSELEPKAKQYDVIVKQVRETGLDQSDLNTVFEIGTLLKRGDVFGARAKLEPIWAQVNAMTGGRVPDDLVQEVAAGKLAAERAQELAVARAAAEVGARQQQQAVRDHETRQQEALTSSTVETVNAWEATQARLDPDWKLKAPLVRQALELSVTKGFRPKSPDEAVQMAKKALEDVNAQIRAFRPAPKAIRPMVGGAAASTRSNPAEPKTMLDVVRSALG